MNNAEILRIAAEQSAIDCGCSAGDFFSGENRVVLSRAHPGARRYLDLPFLINLVSYGGGIVASVSPEFEALAGEYINKYLPEHCFETPNLHYLMDRLRPLGASACFMAEYWLPDVTRLAPLPCPYELRELGPKDFPPLYTPAWSNALCEKRKHLDVLALGAYDGDKLIGLAGCSMDCDTMWQIGIDVLPVYRRRGIAAALVSGLAARILDRGKVPFYCCAWSNIPSARCAIKSGFRPAWVELTAKRLDFIDEMNK
ncbi:MAG: GNAT family N-acetyltransferase [Clostridiales bacterium]|nr:GNAT family N-acetyltransferase [Clostridiales bacterium]